MNHTLRDVLLFLVCVVLPCGSGLLMERPNHWSPAQWMGAMLFFLATGMVFGGIRMLFEVWSETAKKRRNALRMALAMPVPVVAPAEEEELNFLEEKEIMVQLSDDEPWFSDIDENPRPVALHGSSEIIHVEYHLGSARVVALLRPEEEPGGLHLLELDVTGEDLRPEVLVDAVEGVATGELALGVPHQSSADLDGMGPACSAGWGLTLPCPPHLH